MAVVALLVAGKLACPATAGVLKDIPRGFHLVARDNCGVKGQASNLLIGASCALSASNFPELKLQDERLSTSARSTAVAIPIYRTANVVLLRYRGLWPDARYAVRVWYCNPFTNECVQVPLANGRPLASAPTRLPPGVPLTQVFEVPPETLRRSAALDLEFRLRAGPCAQVSAVELWSDRANLMAYTPGFHMRFRVDAMPSNGKPFSIKSSDWGVIAVISNAGLTPWIKNPKVAAWSIWGIDTNAAGATLFSDFAPTDPTLDVYLRQVPWQAEIPGKQSIHCSAPQLRVFNSTRDLARLYYRLTLAQVGEKLWPLARPPLLFGNAWCHTDGPRNDYHLKTLRLLGMNCVAIGGPEQKYSRLYGWSVYFGDYDRPFRLPFDEAEVRAFQQGLYTNYFAKRGPEAAVCHLVEMTGEMGIKAGDQAAEAGFRRWLAAEKVPPKELGAKSMDEVALVLKDPRGADDTPANRRRYYWSRRYRAWLTPRGYALAGEAMRRSAPNPDLQPYVGVSGHTLYLNNDRQTVNPLPIDLFALASYPEIMPMIGDWMTPNVADAHRSAERREAWRQLTHETVAYSAAFFNSGARRYGADFGKPPLSRAMMSCVYPALFRAYTMLGNQVKSIAYYNYGPRYAGEGYPTAEAWAGHPAPHHAVGQVNNQAALADDLLGPGSLRSSRVALLYARATDYYAAPDDPAPSSRRALFLGLSHEYYKPELVTEEQIAAGALAHYDALYAADPWVSAAAQAAIAAWVKKGGLLWACDGALRFDEYREPRDLLADAGLKRSWITAAERTNALAAAKSASNAPAGELQMVPVPGESDFEPHPVFSARREGQPIGPRFLPWQYIVIGRSWGCREAEWPGARVRARYSDGASAWLEKNLDKGRVVYVPHDVGVDYSLWRDPQPNGDLTFWRDPGAAACRAVLTAPLREAKVARPLEVSVPALMASPVGTEAGTVVVLYNMIAATNENVVFTLPAPGQPHSVQVIRGGPREPEVWSHPLAAYPCGGKVLRGGASAPENLPNEYAAGAVKITLPRLPDPGDGCLLVVRHKPPPPDPRLEEMRKNAAANLASDDWEALSAGAWFAGFFPDWGLGAKLVPLLKHQHWAVRRAAAEGLGRMKFSAASGELRKAIDGEKDAHVLADMLIALDRLGHPDVPALAGKLVLHDNPWVHDEAAAILLRR